MKRNNSVSVASPPQTQQHHRYIKRESSSSKLKRSGNQVQFEGGVQPAVATSEFRPIAVAPITPPLPPYIERKRIMGIKLYSVSDSPPTLAVRMGLKYLDIDYETVNIDFGAGELITPGFLEKNPQGEVPLLDDNGFMLSESVAILQYLADKYRKDETFYPVCPQGRALVNHRLAFHLSTLYRRVSDYMMMPLCYAYSRTEENLKKLLHALKVFEEYMNRSKSDYVAGGNLTIADLPMVADLVCLNAMTEYQLTLSPFPLVRAWYEGFKTKHPDLWAVANEGLTELTEFEKNPPDLSHLSHPIHPTDKSKLK